jgi:NuA3 HAT complex component NTO1
MKSAQGVEPGALTAYCEKHLPVRPRHSQTRSLPTEHAFQKEQADIREAALLVEEEEEEDQYQNAQLSKSARAYNKTYKPGPPLVPAIIIDRILQYISRTTIRKKQDFVASMCKYWSLKREARRGAPLLKRLHLEPWTASSSSKTQGEEEKVMKLEVCLFDSSRNALLMYGLATATSTQRSRGPQRVDTAEPETRESEAQTGGAHPRVPFSSTLSARS